MNIKIPKPCHANWETMTPEEKGRFCSACHKNVIDVSSLESTQALHSLRQENTCARITYNSRGEIKTKQGFSSLLLIGGLLACSSEDVSTKPTQAISPHTVPTTQTSIATKPIVAEPEMTKMGEVEPEELHEEPCTQDKNSPKDIESIKMGKIKIHTEENKSTQ